MSDEVTDLSRRLYTLSVEELQDVIDEAAFILKTKTADSYATPESAGHLNPGEVVPMGALYRIAALEREVRMWAGEDE